MGILENMKKQIEKSGANKGKLMFFREGQKYRVRFLTDFQDGIELLFHDSFAKSVNCVCEKETGEKKCRHCDNEELRHRYNYAWPVYSYDDNEVKVFLFPVNNCTPIPALISMFETYGTIKDRDYIVIRSGKQQSTSYSLVPMDKGQFKQKPKVPSKQAIINMIGKAYPADVQFTEKDDDEEFETNKTDYSELKPKELYQLCKERGIEAKPKKEQSYYIALLEEYDDDNNSGDDDWDELVNSKNDDDDW